MLTQMNNRATVTADATARAYLESYADYTGQITRPVLTLHTTQDGLVAAQNITVYKETIVNAGHSDWLQAAVLSIQPPCLNYIASLECRLPCKTLIFLMAGSNE